MSKIKYSDGSTFHDITPDMIQGKPVDSIDELFSDIVTCQSPVTARTVDIDGLWKKLSGTPASIGSIALLKKESGEGSQIPAGWYNYIYITHRTGTAGDDTRWSTILLFTMVGEGNSYIVKIHDNTEEISSVEYFLTGKIS